MQMEEMIICQRLIILDMQELVQIGKKKFSKQVLTKTIM